MGGMSALMQNPQVQALLQQAFAGQMGGGQQQGFGGRFPNFQGPATPPPVQPAPAPGGGMPLGPMSQQALQLAGAQLGAPGAPGAPQPGGFPAPGGVPPGIPNAQPQPGGMPPNTGGGLMAQVGKGSPFGGGVQPQQPQRPMQQPVGRGFASFGGGGGGRMGGGLLSRR